MISLLGPLILASVASSDSPTVYDEFQTGRVEVDGTTIPYRLLTPQNVVEGDVYPLILFLHGAGERGDNNETQLVHFPARMTTPERRAAKPCFVLAPQCPKDARWTTASWGETHSSPIDAEPTVPMRGAIEALIEVIGVQPVDTSRIYLTGLSMGGYGTFDLATRHADWFAAAVAVCGGGDERQAVRLAGLPMSIWHGDADRAVPVERSRQMVAALKALGEAPLYHELEGVGHDAWNHAYAENGCLEWLFEQRRDPRRRLASAARLMAESLEESERLAFLGDSITQAGNAPGGFVDLLRTAIKRVRPDATVIPAGISGHKVPDLLAREERDVREKGATIVFTYIGINDVWHSQSGRGTPLDEYVSGLETLMTTFESKLGATNVIATPTVIGEAPEGDNKLDGMLTQFTAASRRVAGGGRVAGSNGRTLCDLHAIFRAHLRVFNAAGKAKGCLTTDGVHLNEAGNVLVATEAALAIPSASALTRCLVPAPRTRRPRSS